MSQFKKKVFWCGKNHNYLDHLHRLTNYHDDDNGRETYKTTDARRLLVFTLYFSIIDKEKPL